MIDLDSIGGFDWDDGNARKKNEKHGIGQTEAEEVFFQLAVIAAGRCQTQ